MLNTKTPYKPHLKIVNPSNIALSIYIYIYIHPKTL